MERDWLPLVFVDQFEATMEEIQSGGGFRKLQQVSPIKYLKVFDH